MNPDMIKIRLADFNRRSYSEDRLMVSGDVWDDGLYLIYIYTFRTVSIAQGFLEELRESRYVFGNVPREFYQLMLITAENFQTLMKQRNKDAYQYFYELNYSP
jgi:hypothetical protein